ncbi:hypothetical protein HZA40_02705 [Candidatus Peregrinibacteria bacterium]|nr:hypothetical protein [Candidatus Peregrinibacteria bacterium]
MVTLIFGGFWYFRNWIITGNPLFPLDVKLFGIRIFDGYLGLTEKLHEYSMSAHLGDTNIVSQFFENYILSSGTSGLLAISGVLLSVFLLLKIGKKYKIIMILLFTSLILFTTYLISPFSYQNIYPNIRYLIPFIFVGFILFIYLIGKIKRAVFLIYFLAIITILSTTFLIAKQSKYLEFVNDYVFVSFDLPQFRTYNDIFVRDVSTDTTEHKYVIHKDLIKAFEFVNANITDEAKIAYTNFGVHYPLFGENMNETPRPYGRGFTRQGG